MVRTRSVFISLLLAATVCPQMAHAQVESLEAAAQAFGARPTVLDISLSPAGDRVAYVTPGEGSTEVVFLRNLGTDAAPRLITYLSDPDLELTGCDWASDTHLVCQFYGITYADTALIGFTRMLSIPLDGSAPVVLTARDSYLSLGLQQDGGTVLALDVPGADNRVLLTRDFVPEFSTGSRNASTEDGLGVEAVDVTTGRRSTVEEADQLASRYIADETGRVRLRVRRLRDNRGLLTGETAYHYRTRDNDSWVAFSTSLADFAPVAVDSGLNVAYGFSEVGGYGSDWFGRNGFQAWELAIGDVNDAGRWLVAEGIADPAKLGILGWSYGGYAALQSQVVDASLYRAVVAIAPVTDLDDLREQARPYTNYTLVSRFVGDGPHVAAGSPARHPDSFQAPVLLFHGTRDLNVNVRQSQVMASRLEDAARAVTYREYEGLDHSLDNAASRSSMLEEIGAFLDRHLRAQP